MNHPSPSYDALLIVAHGSTSADGVKEILGIVPELRALVDEHVRVEVGFLELAEPPAITVAMELAESGARHIVVVPLMLNAAGHARSDVPAVVLTARNRYPDVTFTYAEPLGKEFALLERGRDALQTAGGTGKPLLVFFRGASEPSANAQSYEITRLLAELNESRSCFTGFSGITWPSIDEALAQLHAVGHREFAVLSWFLATGVLVDRINDAVTTFAHTHHLVVRNAGHLGINRAIAELVIERADAAVKGAVQTPCDLCAYRRPYPGLIERIGAPRGQGHSHFADEHLHSHR
ncbi:MAG: sirohydrochlorin chelatase [Acidimicrobiales bacterium]